MAPAEKEARIVKALTEPMSISSLSDFSELTAAQLYPTLIRMEVDGRVLSEWDRSQHWRRRIYRLA